MSLLYSSVAQLSILKYKSLNNANYLGCAPRAVSCTLNFMTIAEWLIETMKRLGEAGVDSPRRDALVLLEDTLKKDRAWVLAHPDHRFQGGTLETVNALIERRIKREPLAYIRGKAWFYGRFFTVNEHVLIPRPESETIVEIVKEIAPTTVVDIGTGSGCLAITIALELPEAHVTASDISTNTLELARHNAYQHKVSVHFMHTYLLEGVLDQHAPEVIVANLPYVPENLAVEPELKTEPRLALFAGADGMDVYENFWAQISTAGLKAKYIVTESLESQHTHMNELAVKSGYRLAHSEHLIQLWKLENGV